MTRASAGSAPSPSASTDPLTQIQAAATQVRQLDPGPSDIGVVLGSGLGAWATRLEKGQSLPYSSLPNMPRPTVAGHPGQLWLGLLGGVKVACLQGRVHAYEGHPVERVVFGVRLLAALGCRAVLLTNAAGGIRADLPPGSLMLVADHLNLTGKNPLIGWATDGHPPFIDLTHAYDPRLARAAHAAADQRGLHLSDGVYAALLGPSYETPAEIRMLRALGADAVGMSTALEAIALRERGVAVGAVSCITNAAAGLSSAPLSHADVQETAARSRQHFEALLDDWVVGAAEAIPEASPNDQRSGG